MKRSLFCLVVIALSSIVASAQPTDVIVTRNGSVYEGYISSQIPGKRLTVCSSRTTMTVPRLDAKITRSVDEMLGDLPDEYAALFPLLNDEDYVECADIVVIDKDGRDIEFNNSVILESGEEIKFVSFSTHSIDLNWSEIKLSSKVPYDLGSKYGIKDVLYFPSAERVEGQFMGQNLLNGMMTFRDSNGKVTVYRKSAVQALRFEIIDKSKDFWVQVPYCDKVLLKNGTSVDGFIVSKIFGKSVSLMNYNSEISTDIPVSDIVSYEKYPNPQFEPLVEKEVETVSPDLIVNGEVCDFQVLYSNPEKSAYWVAIPKDSISLQIKKGDKTVIEFKESTRTSKVRIACPDLTKEKIFSVKGLKVKKTETKYWPTFTTSEFVVDADINFQSNDNEYIVADIVFDKPGVYVLFVEGSEKCVAVNVKD